MVSILSVHLSSLSGLLEAERLNKVLYDRGPVGVMMRGNRERDIL
jgi:hypothetical protein